MPYFNKENKREGYSRVLTAAVCVLLVLVLLGGAGLYAYRKYSFVNDYKNDIKYQVKRLVSYAAVMDGRRFSDAANIIEEDSQIVRSAINGDTFWVMVGKLPVINKEMKNINRLLDTADGLIGTALMPLAELMTEQPLFTKENKKPDVAALKSYIDFADEKLPEIAAIIGEASDIELKFADRSHKITGYLKLADSLLNGNTEGISRLTGILSKHNIDSIISKDGLDLAGIDALLSSLQEALPEIHVMLGNIAADMQKAGNSRIAGLVSLAGRECEILQPFIEFQAAHPLSGIKAPDDINYSAAAAYIEIVGRYIPDFKKALHLLKDGLASEGYSDERMDLIILQADAALDLAANAIDGVGYNAAAVFKSYPPSNLSTERGFSVQVMRAYLDFLDRSMPELFGLCERLERLDVSAVYSGTKISEICEKLRSMLEIYGRYSELLRILLGSGSDRHYVLIAQNTAEIRASGGFPGAVGSIDITDGYLKVGEFKAVYDSFVTNPPNAKPSNEVKLLSSGLVDKSWDMGLCPDFPEVAAVWADAYNERNGIKTDGIISMTPHIIQDLLKVYGDVRLSDGTVLSGSYAVDYISHDIYMKYIPRGADFNEGNAKTDSLFYESARETVLKVTQNLDLAKLLGLARIFEKRSEDGCIVIYMADEAEQSTIEAMGISGSLSTDSQKPELGMFFSIHTPCKMGWFIGTECSVGEPVVNSDGSRSYEVSLTYTNLIGQEEIEKASEFVLGGRKNGTVYAYNIFSAPAGGSISSMKHSKWNDSNFIVDYKGMQCMRLSGYIKPGEPVTYTFTVTTAPGTDAPLKLHMTPNYNEYR